MASATGARRTPIGLRLRAIGPVALMLGEPMVLVVNNLVRLRILDVLIATVGTLVEVRVLAYHSPEAVAPVPSHETPCESGPPAGLALRAGLVADGRQRPDRGGDGLVHGASG